MPSFASLNACAEVQAGHNAAGTAAAGKQTAEAAPGAAQPEQAQPGKPARKRGQIQLPAAPQQKGGTGHGRIGSRKAQAAGQSTGALNLKRTQRSGQ